MQKKIFTEEELECVQQMDLIKPGCDQATWLWHHVGGCSVLLRHKALERLKTVSGLDDKDMLETMIGDAREREEIRLRALDVMLIWLKKEKEKNGQDSSRYREGLDFLFNMFFDRNPYFSKGVVAGLGYLGGEEALRVLFRIISMPQGRIVYPKMVEEAIDVGSERIADFGTFLADEIKKEPRLAIYLKGYQQRKQPIYHHSVYPSHDYMALKIKEQHFDYRHFKYLVGTE